MSMDISLDARRIGEAWPVIAGKLPAPLASAIAAFEAAEYVEPPTGGMDAEKITDKNVTEAVHSLTQAFALEDAFVRAQHKVRDALAYRVLREASEAVPELFDRLEPEFDAAVAEYRAAVDSLPPDHAAAALIAAGPSAVEAYHRAVAAQGSLDRFHGWIASMHDLPAFSSVRREPALYLLRPSTRSEFQLLLNAGGKKRDSDLNPVYLAAVEAGLPFAMHTPADAKAIADEINAMPVEKNPGLRFVRW